MSSFPTACLQLFGSWLLIPSTSLKSFTAKKSKILGYFFILFQKKIDPLLRKNDKLDKNDREV